jgi:hypothetical protein
LKNKIAAFKGFGHFVGFASGFGELREEGGLLDSLFQRGLAIGLESAQHGQVLLEAAMNSRFVETQQI